jgi:hypothetical protein
MLAWADAHRHRTGNWPTRQSGPVREAPGETWAAVDAALRNGNRGLKGGSSLARFLARHRGARNHLALPPLRIRRILGWANAHRRRTGQWPTANSNPIPEAPSETWSAVDAALRKGNRGLEGGSSLARILAQHCPVKD